MFPLTWWWPNTLWLKSFQVCMCLYLPSCDVTQRMQATLIISLLCMYVNQAWPWIHLYLLCVQSPYHIHLIYIYVSVWKAESFYIFSIVCFSQRFVVFVPCVPLILLILVHFFLYFGRPLCCTEVCLFSFLQGCLNGCISYGMSLKLGAVLVAALWNLSVFLISFISVVNMLLMHILTLGGSLRVS